MRLVAFGCSQTWGSALPDVWGIKENQTIHERGVSKYAWPKLLANKLDVECVNLGIAGASNKEIWYNILHTTFYKNDIVIILWTHSERFCFIHKNKIMTLGTWMVANPTAYRTSEQSKIFYKHLYNEYDMLLDFYLRANHIQTFLQNKVELIKHNAVCRLEPDVNVDWNNIKSSLFMEDFLEQYLPKALDGSHPGTGAHEAFATAIYNEIKDENPEKFN